MRSSVIQRWVSNFYKGRENVHDDPRSGRSSVVNEDLMRLVVEKVRANGRVSISSLSLHFLQISRSFSSSHL